jgi:hypothetical protein
MKFHISRWQYWWGYLAVFLLVLLAIWFTDRAQDFQSYIAGGIALIVLVVFEFIVRKEKVRFAEDGIEIIRGKDVEKISFDSVSDASAIQTALQSVLRFGDVLIKIPNREIVLNNFEEPGKIARAIGTRIHVTHELHGHHKGGPRV